MNYEEYIQRDLPIVLNYNDRYKNYELDELIKLGESNDSIALYEIGIRYCNGVNIEEDKKRCWGQMDPVC
ncbi:MAG: hypothetical protein IJ600_06615 [Lachnospiraceae bacterium]|nr:hypothetical protein [Lachnospiraceae bacterium]